MMKIHTLPMGPVQANCYVVIDEHSGEAAVIDPGDYTDELKSVLRDEVKNLKYILLTHGHYDHILGVAHIKDDYPDAKIAIHPYDSPCLKRLAALDGEYTVYTGHNRSTTLSEERVRNRYLRKIPRGEL